MDGKVRLVHQYGAWWRESKRVTPDQMRARLNTSPKAFAVLALTILCLASICGDTTKAAENDVLKIGFLLPPDEPQATSIREGLLLAGQVANQTSKSRVDVIIRGRNGQWGADGVEAARMVTDDGVAGLITPPDGAASHLTLQVSGRTAVPVVSLCADSSVGRTGVPWLLGIVPRTEDEAAALFRELAVTNRPNTNRWIAIVPDGRAGREISKDLNHSATACGMKFQTVLELNTGFTNVESVQKRALSDHPEVILLWLPPIPAGKITKNLRAAGYHGLLTGPSWLQSQDFISAAEDSLEGFIIPEAVRKSESANKWNSFRVSYRDLYQREPDIIAGVSYDAVMLLIHLLRQPDFQSPPHRLPPGFTWPGVTGDLSFDSDGNRAAKLVLVRAHGGRFDEPN